LYDAIETERENLSKAESLLGCLALAMQQESDPVRGPYYPDVAEVARDLVTHSVKKLDSLALQQRLLQDKVKEAASVVEYLLAAPRLSRVPEEEYAIAMDRLYPSLHWGEACSPQ
jgi:hypothetical protein